MTATPQATGFEIGRVGSRLFGVVGRNFVLFGSLALLLVGGPAAMLALAQIGFMSDVLGGQGSADPSAALANLFAPAQIGLGVASALIGVVGNAALQGAVIHASISDLSGKRAEFGDCLGTGLRFFLPLFCIGLIVGVCCFFGYLIFIVPGVLLGLAWCVAAPAEVVERTGVFAALARSAELTRNHRGAIFVVIIVFIVMVIIVQQVVTSATQVGFGVTGAALVPSSPGFRGYMAVVSVVGVAMQVAISSLAAAGLASIYFELRYAKDGVGAQELAAVFD